MLERIGRKSPSFAGRWAPATDILSIVGLAEKGSSLRRFVDAVRQAERENLRYGVKVVGRRSAPVAVVGVAEYRRWLFTGRREWAIGTVDEKATDRVARRLIEAGAPLAAELVEIVIHGDGMVDVRFRLLAPPGRWMALKTLQAARAH